MNSVVNLKPMSSVVNLKQRVAAAEAALKALAPSDPNRHARIMGLLETVEKNIAHKQQQIGDLTNERDSALDEVERLKDMLENTEKLQKRDQGMGFDEMDELLDRLDKIASI